MFFSNQIVLEITNCNYYLKGKIPVIFNIILFTTLKSTKKNVFFFFLRTNYFLHKIIFRKFLTILFLQLRNKMIKKFPKFNLLSFLSQECSYFSKKIFSQCKKGIVSQLASVKDKY